MSVSADPDSPPHQPPDQTGRGDVPGTRSGKSHTCGVSRRTHQALPLHAHVIRGDVDTGGSISDHLGQADVEAIAGGSAGQLALLVRAHCKITRGGGMRV